jgi:hypothetical protein
MMKQQQQLLHLSILSAALFCKSGAVDTKRGAELLDFIAEYVESLAPLQPTILVRQDTDMVLRDDGIHGRNSG